MSSDRELRAQIEDAEARLRSSRQTLLERRDTFPQRVTALEEDRRELGTKLDALRSRITQVKLELEKVNAQLGENYLIDPVAQNYDGKGELTVVDGLVNALFGQTPDWAQGQSFGSRFVIRFNQGMGKRR
ncbi:MAG: hypothetical protein QM817_20570 [Archangium sp.]